jgi:hypothetical protein
MPLITPSYLYTFVALLAVSSLLVFSFIAYTDAVRFSSETRQLKSLMNRIAAKTTEMLTLTPTINVTLEVFIEMPPSIGKQQYWIRLQNDSAKAWLEGGLGEIPIEKTDLCVYLLKEVFVTGYYTAGHGAARLTCHVIDNVPNIQLTSFSEEY